MIELGKLQFSNCLPFGDNIEIDLAKNVTTQLVGKNGSGKSSIPLILEEILYNKNSKGVAKGDILNRFSGATEYTMKLDFKVNGTPYSIEKVVKTTAKVTLMSDGVNIGGHTATQTYKIVADILGMDMTTFSKLVYQSLTSSLDFLTATDGNRKKFLINLLNLENYPSIETRIKEERKDVANTMTNLTRESDRLEATIKSTIIPDVMLEIEVPESLADKYHDGILKLSEAKSIARNSLDNLQERVDTEKANALKDAEIHKHKLQEWNRQEAICQSIDNDINILDNKLIPEAKQSKEYLDTLKPPDESNISSISDAISRLEETIRKLQWDMDETKKLYKTFTADALETICTACNSPLDKAQAAKEAENKKQLFIQCKSQRDSLQAELVALQREHKSLSLESKLYKDAKYSFEVAEQAVVYAEKSLAKKQAEFAKSLGANIEAVLSAKPMTNLLSAKPMVDLLSAKPTINIKEESEALKAEITSIDKTIAELRLDIIERDKLIKRAQEYNIEAAKNNMKLDILQESYNKAVVELKGIMQDKVTLQTRLTNIDVLAKIFGPKGLIAYKLESCVKVFENKVNEYLSSISGGKFALGFELDEANLKVIMFSSGKQVNIRTLSSGELSKVNISTLLSIRSLMSAVSKNSLNALFLDEVVSTIDEEGMEDLIEVLIKEHNLNTFVVSHNYQHPLVEVLKVIKENNISRLENGDWS